jgi:hypothetical protein
VPARSSSPLTRWRRPQNCATASAPAPRSARRLQ